uniref:Transposase n=1 Tax=Globodera rostochiensis TaxID=31243 RepID=A0A914HQ53_GLORO
MKAELKRAGFKNSHNHQIDETVAKELCITYRTIYAWKSELGQSTPKHKYSDSEQKELMKRYYEIKGQNPIINGKSNLKAKNFIQILSMDILWK